MSTNLGQAAAIDPATGETTWVYGALEDGAGRPRGGATRGVGYWDDPERDDERVFVVSGEQLVALDARTGDPLREFGTGGKVDLTAGVPHLEEYRWTAAPLICRDTVIVGIFTIDQFDRRDQAPGYIRGYDAVTGQLKWRFNTIPQPGEFGHETWEDGSWEHTGASNVWTVASADEELGYAYLPTATPTHNWYGGHRPGDNLFAETLLCLECETGRRVWHYQLIHHGVWDYDTASTPILADITVDGRPIKAVVQVTKQAFAYVFDRVTGEPVWPIELLPPLGVHDGRALPALADVAASFLDLTVAAPARVGVAAVEPLHGEVHRSDGKRTAVRQESPLWEIRPATDDPVQELTADALPAGGPRSV
ncbi:MAG: PQQ-binding-like beta-propeller repeat protein [Acidobacteria bacterium]|nr:PQQ-binding-like beta-propeller repeat protein [Acidobacteriota bacterium]